MAILYSRPSWKPPQGTPIDGSHPLARGLVGAWAFNEGSGTAADLTGEGNTGVLTGGASWSPGGGQWGPAIAFVGNTNQYVSLGSSPSLMPPAISYSVWARATAFAEPYNAAISRNAGSTFAQILVKSTGKLAMYVDCSGGIADYDGTGTHTLATGVWYHLVLTYDSVNGLKGYVDGVPDGTAAAKGTVSPAAAATTIGSDIESPPRYWGGQIDFPLIYNRSLTAAEVQQLYQNPWQLFRPRVSIASFGSAGPGTASAALAVAEGGDLGRLGQPSPDPPARNPGGSLKWYPGLARRRRI